MKSLKVLMLNAELWNMQQGIYRRREPVAKQPVAAAVVEDDDDGEAFTY